MTEDAEFLGIPGAFTEPSLVIVPEAWGALRAFLAAATKWRIGPSGHLTGLDHHSTAAVAKAIDVEFADVFDDLQVMESVGLDPHLIPSM